MDYVPGDYRIQPLEVGDIHVDGVQINDEGVWLGVVEIEEVDADLVYQWVKPLLHNGKWVAAPVDWQERILEFLSSPSV